MADSSSPSNADTGAPVSRVCVHCGKTIRLKAEYAGVAVKCPSCSAVLRPAASEGVRVVEYVERVSWIGSVAAWAGSAFLHGSLLVVFAGITWFSGFSGGGEEREVGIVTDQGGSSIEAAEADVLRIHGSTNPLNALQMQESLKVEPITDLGPGSTTSEREAIIGIDMTAGASEAAMKGDWASFAGSGGGAGAGKASFFGIEAEGGRFVFVVDRSSSMHGDRLAAAKEELKRSIRELEPTMEFGVIFYSDRPAAMNQKNPQTVSATSKNKQAYFRWIAAVRAEGGTKPSEAVKLALSLRPDAVWLLSDGGFNNPSRAIATIREANRKLRIPIHAIAFYDRSAEGNARQVAKDSGGTYRFVAGPGSGWGP